MKDLLSFIHQIFIVSQLDIEDTNQFPVFMDGAHIQYGEAETISQ